MKRIINTQTLEVLKNFVLNTIAKASPHIEAAKANQLNTVSQKFTNLNNWYMRITCLDKVILAQEKVTALQKIYMKRIINTQTLEVLKNSVLNTIAKASPHIQAAKANQLNTVSQKFTNLNNWYMRITGLDKVILAQEKVTAMQNQLLQIQDKRREVGRHLSEVRQKSIELQDEIHKVKRQDNLEMFLDLMKRETEILKLEQSVSKTFQEYDQAERELFTAFTDSIRDSHEKQRAQMEYTKYFGIVLSITGSFLAFVYSTLKKDQLKRMIDERLQVVNREVLSDFANVVSTKLSQYPKSTVEFMPFYETQTNNDKIISYVVIFSAIIGLGLLLGKLASG